MREVKEIRPKLYFLPKISFYFALNVLSGKFIRYKVEYI